MPLDPRTEKEYRELIEKGFGNVSVSLKASNDQTDDYALEIKHLQKADFFEPPKKSGHWTPFWINKHCYLIFGEATQDTDFAVQGELICKLVFLDPGTKHKRSIRIKPDDLKYRDFELILKTVRRKFAGKFPRDP